MKLRELSINKKMRKSPRKAVKALKKMSVERRMINLLNLLDCYPHISQAKKYVLEFKKELLCIKKVNQIVRDDDKKLAKLATEKYKICNAVPENIV